MNVALRRGACPTLAAPMQTGDGLLARLNPIASGLAPQALVGLCEAALQHGNGVVEVTSRGSFQIRGLTRRSAGLLAAEIDLLGIDVRMGVPVEVGPLAGLDPGEVADPRPLARRIREGVVAAGLEGRLGPKVSVIVDGGGHFGMDDLLADVRLNALPGRAAALWRLAVGGNAAFARPVGDFPEEQASKAAVAILAEIAAMGPEGRGAKLSRPQLDAALSSVGHVTDVAPPSVLPDISPTRGEIGRPLRFRQFATSAIGETLDDGPISLLVGEMSGRTEGGNVERDAERPIARRRAILPLSDSRFAAAIALPFGHTRAETLIELVKAPETAATIEIRLAPRRTLLFLCPSEPIAHAVLAAAGTAGFVVDPADPRTRIAACPGSPACASGHIPARAMAAEVAASMPAGLDLDLHISGCAKRCAGPRHVGLTLLGGPDGAALVLGAPGAAPLAHVAHEHAAAAIGRVLELIAAERRPGVSDERRMHQLGKQRLAQAFRGKG